MTTSTDLTTSTELRFTIWPDTNTDGIITDSDDALYTGRDAIFVPCECVPGGAR